MLQIFDSMIYRRHIKKAMQSCAVSRCPPVWSVYEKFEGALLFPASSFLFDVAETPLVFWVFLRNSLVTPSVAAVDAYLYQNICLFASIAAPYWHHIFQVHKENIKMEESGKRGKPSSIDKESIKRIFLERRDDIVVNNKILPPKHPIWSALSSELNVKNETLYSYAVSDRYNYRNILIRGDETLDSSCNVTDPSSKDCSMTNEAHTDQYFSFSMPKKEFEDLLVQKEVLAGKYRTRMKTILKENEWTQIIHSHLWNFTRSRHGFSFKNHYLNRDGSHGRLQGKNFCRFDKQIEGQNVCS